MMGQDRRKFGSFWNFIRRRNAAYSRFWPSRRSF